MGSVEFRDNSVAVKTALKEAGIAWLHEACGELVSQTARNSRVRTGKTKGSYEYAVDEATMEGYVGSNYENAIWEEFGTGEYALNGDGRKGGWFYKDASGEGHFTHGKRPNRPLFNAFASFKTKLIIIAKKHYSEIDSKGSGGNGNTSNTNIFIEVKKSANQAKDIYRKTERIVDDPFSVLPDPPRIELPKAPQIKVPSTKDLAKSASNQIKALIKK